VHGLGLVVALEQDAECLSPRLAVGTAERLQSGERELGLGDREPALADQPAPNRAAAAGKRSGAAAASTRTTRSASRKSIGLGSSCAAASTIVGLPILTARSISRAGLS
jgi:hypothetical protein